MRAKWRSVLLVALCAAVLCLSTLDGCQSRQRANRAEAALLSALGARDSLLHAAAAKIDTVYRRDTVRLWRLSGRVDTLTQTVDRWKHDTIRVLEFVAAADSTIQACRAVVLTCEARVAAEQAIGAAAVADRDSRRARAGKAERSARWAGTWRGMAWGIVASAAAVLLAGGR